MRRCYLCACLAGMISIIIISALQSPELEAEAQFFRNRQLTQQSGTSFQGVSSSYFNPSQSSSTRNACHGRTGYVADPSRNCQVFYNCLPDGTVTTGTCPGNFQFDETSQCCKMPHDVNCPGLVDNSNAFPPPISCLGRRGFFPDLGSGCQVFYFCEPSGRSRRLTCPTGLLFNELIGCCDVSQNVYCGIQSRPMPATLTESGNSANGHFCRNRRPGFYSHPRDCARYYYCQNAGQGTSLRCPTGLAFNEKSASCDSDLSRCYGIQVDNTVFDCSGRNGWYRSEANDPNCRYAFYCNAGLSYQHSCPSDLRWSIMSLSCVTPDRVQCGSSPAQPRPTWPPLTTPIPVPPYYPTAPGNSYDTGSSGYAYNNPPNFPVQPPGYGNSGISGNSNANLGLGIDIAFDCRGKIGYYAIQETGCSQFVYCNPEGIAHKFDCPSTLLFNNSLALCDWPQNVHCKNQILPGYLPSTQSQPSFDCRGKDGFFADHSRGGRIFYMCHGDGTKFQYVCPSNLVFNEQRSVCDWSDYMRNGGFTERTPDDLSQMVAADWNGRPLDCRIRPAGFYAHPTNNRVYGRCTPDGTFIPMRCPQTTVFLQTLGQCVFPFQMRQQQQNPEGVGYYGMGMISAIPNVNPNSSYAVFPGTYGGPSLSVDSENNPDTYASNYGIQNNAFSQGTGDGSSRTGTGNQVGGNLNYGNQEIQNVYNQGTEYSGDHQGTNMNGINNANYVPVVYVQTGSYNSGDSRQTSSQYIYPAATYAPYEQNEFRLPDPEISQENIGNQIAPTPDRNGPYGATPLNSLANNAEITYGNVGDQGTPTTYGSQQYSEIPGGYRQPVTYAIPNSQTTNEAYTANYIPSYESGPGNSVSAICMGRTGVFPHRAVQCRRYTICRSDGRSETRSCSGNMVFNEKTGQCDVPRNTNCFADASGITQPSVPICLKPTSSGNTFVPDIAQSCMAFYSCGQNGQGIRFQCPTGLQFNSKINACDDPRSCNCMATGGGSITVHLPVAASPVDSNLNTAYSNLNQQTSQDIDLDITVRRQRQGTSENMPLVPGYDSSLYADSSRLPSFYADDEHMASGADENTTGQIMLNNDTITVKQVVPAESSNVAPFPIRLSFEENQTHTGSQQSNSSYRGLPENFNKSFANILRALTVNVRRKNHYPANT